MVESQTRNVPNWSEMANDLAQTWMDTGTQAWKSWFDLMGMSSTQNFADRARPGYQHLAQGFAENQDLFARLLQLSFKTWQDIVPQVQAGDNWQQSLARYNAAVRQQLEEFFGGVGKATQDLGELWKLYLGEVQKFNQLWVESLGASFGPLSQSVPGTSEPWIELNNLYWNLVYEQTFGSLTQSPILGPSREFNGKLLRSFDAWTDLYRASIDYQAVLASIQVSSFEELMQELVRQAEAELKQGEKGKEQVKDWRYFQNVWTNIADRVFHEAFCQEDNLKIRGKFLNALNIYRIRQQELTELWMKLLNVPVPVRSEVDEIHKNIYELRKEVKRLKKSVISHQLSVTSEE
jgi:class III poly(R)-hydroxyalkanoic acid synthase PhaE subunit